MLSIFDSPLAKAGKIQVFIHTTSNVLIQVSNELRVPRTYKRFAGLITQLLHTRKIKATDSNKVLMKVVKNPVTDHLPVGCVKIGTSVEGALVNIFDYVTKNFGEQTRKKEEEEIAPVFIVGVCAHGHPGKEAAYAESCISISSYHLSAAACLSRIASAFERIWGIN